MTLEVFDRKQLRKNRHRALKNFADHDFLFQWSAKALQDRLSDITRDFENRLSIGTRCALPNSITVDCTDTADVIADHDLLPFTDDSFDLVSSNLSLHSVNDLPGALIQINRALKPDGFFIASLFGGETLHELRDALAQAELKLCEGVSPRVFPFADKQQMGDLMQRARFALPVIDSEIVTVTYPNMRKLLHDLRGMGESNAILARSKQFAPRALFDAAEDYYKAHYSEDGKLIATFEIIFLAGWAPHESQQKPLKPGSAEHSLAEALK